MTPAEFVEALVIRPGDHLVVRFGTTAMLSAQRGEWLRVELESRLPGVQVTVVACDQLAVYRPAGADPDGH